jgi:hypothetical protein
VNPSTASSSAGIWLRSISERVMFASSPRSIAWFSYPSIIKDPRVSTSVEGSSSSACSTR